MNKIQKKNVCPVFDQKCVLFPFAPTSFISPSLIFHLPTLQTPFLKVLKNKVLEIRKDKRKKWGGFAKYYLPHSGPKFLDLSKKVASRKKGQLSSI
jgi:hypothetical protein